MANAKRSSKKRGKSHVIELSAKAAFFWGLCLFFLLVWIFVLGIFVGRGFIPDGLKSISELKAKIAKLQGVIGHRDTASPPVQQKSFEDPKLAFYKNLSTKKKAVVRSLPPKKRKKVARKPVVSAKRNGQNHAARKNAAGQLHEHFTVQIASLGVQEKAKALVTALTAKGYPAYYYKVTLNGSTRYRVRCGSFKTLQEAKGFAQEFFRAEKIRGFVLKEKK